MSGVDISGEDDRFPLVEHKDHDQNMLILHRCHCQVTFYEPGIEDVVVERRSSSSQIIRERRIWYRDKHPS